MRHSKPVRLGNRTYRGGEKVFPLRPRGIQFFGRGKMPRLRCWRQSAIYPPKSVKKLKIIVDLRINETLQTGAVRKPHLPGGESVYLFLEFTINNPNYAPIRQIWSIKLCQKPTYRFRR